MIFLCLDWPYISDGDISIIRHTMQQRYFLCPTGVGSLLFLIDWLNYVKMSKKNKRIRILPCSMNRATQGSHWLDITGILGKDAFHHFLVQDGLSMFFVEQPSHVETVCLISKKDLV